MRVAELDRACVVAARNGAHHVYIYIYSYHGINMSLFNSHYLVRYIHQKKLAIGSGISHQVLRDSMGYLHMLGIYAMGFTVIMFDLMGYRMVQGHMPIYSCIYKGTWDFNGKSIKIHWVLLDGIFEHSFL